MAATAVKEEVLTFQTDVAEFDAPPVGVVGALVCDVLEVLTLDATLPLLAGVEVNSKFGALEEATDELEVTTDEPEVTDGPEVVTGELEVAEVVETEAATEVEDDKLGLAEDVIDWSRIDEIGLCVILN